jgi:hypothetical protein
MRTGRIVWSAARGRKGSQAVLSGCVSVRFFHYPSRLSTAQPNKSALTGILSGSANRQHILTSYVDGKTLV